MATPQIADPAASDAWSPPPAPRGETAISDLPAIGPRVTYMRDAEIFGEGESAEHIYQVQEGVVRTCRFLGDGRRQIEEFHLAGDYFGLELGAEHSCTAEAIGPATVILLRRSSLAELAARDVLVSARLLNLTMSGLARSQKHCVMLGRKGACERVAAFLIDFAQRCGAANLVDLPMSRQEIGDYLGLTIETVSRTFTHLEGDGVIALADRRHVHIRSPQKLRSLCE